MFYHPETYFSFHSSFHEVPGGKKTLLPHVLGLYPDASFLLRDLIHHQPHYYSVFNLFPVAPFPYYVNVLQPLLISTIVSHLSSTYSVTCVGTSTCTPVCTHSLKKKKDTILFVSPTSTHVHSLAHGSTPASPLKPLFLSTIFKLSSFQMQ